MFQLKTRLQEFFLIIARKIIYSEHYRSCTKYISLCRSSPPEVLLRKGVLKICNKFKEEGPRRSVTSMTLQNNFFEIKLRHRCSPVNLLHIFRTSFPTNTSRGLLLSIVHYYFINLIYTKYFFKQIGNITFRKTIFTFWYTITKTKLTPFSASTHVS